MVIELKFKLLCKRLRNYRNSYGKHLPFADCLNRSPEADDYLSDFARINSRLIRLMPVMTDALEAFQLKVMRKWNLPLPSFAAEQNVRFWQTSSGESGMKEVTKWKKCSAASNFQINKEKSSHRKWIYSETKRLCLFPVLDWGNKIWKAGTIHGIVKDLEVEFKKKA